MSYTEIRNHYKFILNEILKKSKDGQKRSEELLQIHFKELIINEYTEGYSRGFCTGLEVAFKDIQRLIEIWLEIEEKKNEAARISQATGEVTE